MVITSEKARATIVQRLREHGEFPTVAESIRRVNELTTDDNSTAAQLAQAILEDYALTNKVLRVVNSAVYGRPTEVTTISRAIVVLGWNSVRSLVVTLKLFDSLPDEMTQDGVRGLMEESFCTGMVARNVATTFGDIREEQAFICGLFHQFGELLVYLYLPELKQEIERLTADGKCSKSVASRLVVGMDYAQLGRSVAEDLRFPSLLVACMHQRPELRHRGRPTAHERITGVTALSGKIKAALLAETAPRNARETVQGLLFDFEKRYGSVGAKPESIITGVVEAMEEHASVLGFPIRSRQLIDRISRAFFKSGPKLGTKLRRPNLRRPNLRRPYGPSRPRRCRRLRPGTSCSKGSAKSEKDGFSRSTSCC